MGDGTTAQETNQPGAHLQKANELDNQTVQTNSSKFRMSRKAFNMFASNIMI